MLLTHLNSSSKLSCFIMTKVSSTYLNQIFGGMEHIEIAFVSNECMNTLATIGVTDDPITTPVVCLYKSPQKIKKTVECKHKSNALIMSEGSRGQRCLSFINRNISQQ
ncbi:unnamed protein product [Schistosoma spindalis]|nr:unnamed protein product [Schistosoma spindale]